LILVLALFSFQLRAFQSKSVAGDHIMNVLVTGCSRGIGRGFVENLLKRNQVASIFAVTTHGEALKALQAESKGRIKILPISVDQEGCVAKLQEALNGVSLDLLINCAGVYPEDGGGFEAISPLPIQEGMRVNVFTAMFTLQGSLSALKRGSHPKVISMTSLMGSITDNTSGGSYAYRMSKTALNMMNKCFSIEYPEFTSVVFHPGWVKTDMGGDEAPTTIQESVLGMLKKIDELKISDSGKFFDFEGDSVPW
jgi:NAD(P)-dependent dehydrogenase (short-subunit alcohol dehydrogenase family)